MTPKEALASPWLTVRVQIALGLFFVVAALPKLVDPPSFAHMIYNYRIVPGAFVNVLALVMPWFELLPASPSSSASGPARRPRSSALSSSSSSSRSR